jgi:hypothetical protein
MARTATATRTKTKQTVKRGRPSTNDGKVLLQLWVEADEAERFNTAREAEERTQSSHMRWMINKLHPKTKK